MVDLSVSIGAVRLPNPIMPGSGTIAEGMTRMIDMGRLGAIVLKTITPDIRQGTLPPRVVEYTDSTLFSIGIPSKGPDHFLNSTLPLYTEYGVPVVASISADTAEDFGALAARLDVDGIDAIEGNISCPNLRANGRAFGMDVEATADVVREMKARTSRPVWAKLTPNVGDIAAIARSAEKAGADAVIVGNAPLGMAVDAEQMRPRLGNVIGGLTGNAIKPIMLRMVHQCAQAVDIPIIGCGGISCGEDAAEYMLAGATAVQMGTVNFIRPTAMLEAIDWIRDYCLRHGLKSVRHVIGAMSVSVNPSPRLEAAL